jgi:general stress protein 26
MSQTALDPAETQSRILQMLNKDPFVFLATFGDTYPDVRAMQVAAKDGADTIWFATETGSSKIAQLRKNPKAAIYGYADSTKEMREFRLFGTVELLSDSASRQKIWQDDFIQHWSDGIDSPTMIVVRFNTERGIFDNYTFAEPGVYHNYAKEAGKF